MKLDPMKMQTANVNTIPCRDCIYRDKAFVTVDGERLNTGVTKDTCMIFDGRNGRWKPNSVPTGRNPYNRAALARFL